jgi:mRNA interferase MazF
LARSPAPRRGDIWIVDFGTPIGHEQGYRRPAVVISDDRLNRSRAGLTIVIPITSAYRAIPSHVRIEPGASGLNDISYAKSEDIKSVSTRRLTRRLGAVPEECIDHIERILRLLLSI